MHSALTTSTSGVDRNAPILPRGSAYIKSPVTTSSLLFSHQQPIAHASHSRASHSCHTTSTTTLPLHPTTTKMAVSANVAPDFHYDPLLTQSLRASQCTCAKDANGKCGCGDKCTVSSLYLNIVLLLSLLKLIYSYRSSAPRRLLRTLRATARRTAPATRASAALPATRSNLPVLPLRHVTGAGGGMQTPRQPKADTGA